MCGKFVQEGLDCWGAREGYELCYRRDFFSFNQSVALVGDWTYLTVLRYCLPVVDELDFENLWNYQLHLRLSRTIILERL